MRRSMVGALVALGLASGNPGYALETQPHVVAEGETLYAIARQYHVSMDLLLQINALDNAAHIVIGQTLKIPAPAKDVIGDAVKPPPSASSPETSPATKPTTHTVAPGETLFAIARTYGMNPFALAKLNHLDNPSKLVAGTVLRLAPASADKPVQPGKKTVFLRPLKGTVVRSFGDVFISGGKKQTSPCLEIAAPGGTEVLAVANGLVLSAGWMKGYGNAIYILHDGGIATFYGNCGTVFFKKGQKVFRGDRIAEVGKPPAGASQSVLSFTVLVKGKAVDPKPYLGE